MCDELALAFLYRELDLLNQTALKIAEKMGVDSAYIKPSEKFLRELRRIYNESN